MKKLFLLILMLGLVRLGYSYSQTIEQPIKTVSDPDDAEISVSSHPWTQLTPAPANALINRDGVVITNPSSNSGNLYIILTTTTTAPTVSTNTAIIEIQPSDVSSVLSVGEGIHLFGNMTGTSAENIYLQEYRQR